MINNGFDLPAHVSRGAEKCVWIVGAITHTAIGACMITSNWREFLTADFSREHANTMAHRKTRRRKRNRKYSFQFRLFVESFSLRNKHEMRNG